MDAVKRDTSNHSIHLYITDKHLISMLPQQIPQNLATNAVRYYLGLPEHPDSRKNIGRRRIKLALSPSTNEFKEVCTCAKQHGTSPASILRQIVTSYIIVRNLDGWGQA